MTRFARAGRKQFEDATPWDHQRAVVATDGGGQSTANVTAENESGKKTTESGKRKREPELAVGTQSSGDTAPAATEVAKRQKSEAVHGGPKVTEKSNAPTANGAARTKGSEKSRNAHLSGEQRDKLRDARRQRRQNAKTCFNCRKFGHGVQDCPDAAASSGVGLCYKCGSTEHITKNCHVRGNDMPYAKCFVCNQTGHLSRSCPDNPRGLYPNGGCCKTCGSVEHFARDCPENPNNQRGKHDILIGRVTNPHDDAADEDDETIAMREKARIKKEKAAASAAASKTKVVKF